MERTGKESEVEKDYFGHFETCPVVRFYIQVYW